MLNAEIAEALEEPYEQARKEGAEKERQKIVQYLRKVGEVSNIKLTFEALAQAIESNKHNSGD